VTSKFYPDRPIEKIDDDRLGRSDFARSLAGSISGWKGRESLVLALCGEWGSGKSSVKNMVLEVLQADGSEGRVQSLQFNPWEIANRQQLTEAFFRELGTTLGTSVFASEGDRKRTVASFRKYVAYVKTGAALVGSLRMVAAAFLLFLPLISVALTSLNTVLGWFVAGVAALLAVVVVAAPKAAEAVAEAVAARVEATVKPLDKLKEDLARDLSKLETKLLIVVDDVDRLLPSEVLEMIQLVKANGDFPNVVYLLLFDRKVIEQNIEKVLAVTGRPFLEKVIQVSFDIPTPSQRDLDEMFSTRLEEVLRDTNSLADFEGPRWSGISIGLLPLYVRTMRHIDRLFSSFSFQASVFGGNGAANVNMMDLLALEVMRLFEPSVYSAIRSMRERLTGGPLGFMDDRKPNDLLQALTKSVATEHQERVREAIVELFPLVKQESTTATDTAQIMWRRERRVCSGDYFDRYFQFSIRHDEIPERDVQELVAATRDREEFRRKLRDVMIRGLGTAAVIRLQAHGEAIESTTTSNVISGLCDIGDELPGERNLLETGPDQFAKQLIWSLLKRQQESERDVSFISGIERSRGIYLPMALVDLVSIESERSEPTPVSVAAAKRVRSLCLERLDGINPETLRSHPRLGFVLDRWAAWGASSQVQNLAERIGASRDGAIALVRAYSTRSVSSNEGVSYKVGFTRLAELVDILALGRVVDAVDTSSVGGVDRLVVEAFRKGYPIWLRESRGVGGKRPE